MGICASKRRVDTPSKTRTTSKSRDIKVKRHVDVVPGSKAKMLITAMDYKGSEAELTCTQDLKNVKEMASLCGLTDLQTMDDTNGPLRKEAVQQKILQMLSGMGNGDTFIFYYSGHGMQVTPEDRDSDDGDKDGDEVNDEAFCYQDENGEAGDPDACWIDDDVAVFWQQNLPQGCHLLLIADCCHSDSICDFDKEAWQGISATSISGCKDGQTSGDVGGGVLTHSLLLTMQKLKEGIDSGALEAKPLNVKWVFATTVKTKRKVFADEEQILSHEHVKGMQPVHWPLIPKQKYMSPMGGGSGGVQDHIASQTTDDADDAKTFYPEDLAD